MAAERLHFAHDATLDAGQISLEEALGSKHTHIHTHSKKKKSIYKTIASVFQWTESLNVCIKNRFIVANESKVFPRQMNRDKKTKQKDKTKARTWHVWCRGVFECCAVAGADVTDATAQMNPGYSQADVTATTKLCFKQCHKSGLILQNTLVYFNFSDGIDLGLFTCHETEVNAQHPADAQKYTVQRKGRACVCI